MKITKSKLKQLIQEAQAKITEARQLPGLGDAPGPKEPDYSEPADSGPAAIRNPERAAEIIYDDIVFDGTKNWIAEHAPGLDLDEVIAALARYMGTPA